MWATTVAALAVLPALAAPEPLRLPVVVPEASTRCTFEGVFPGAGSVGQWTRVSGDAGAWSVDLPHAWQLHGILAHRVDLDSVQPTSWSLTGSTRRHGTSTLDIEQLEVGVQTPGGASGTVRTTVKREVVCSHLPATPKPGDEWTCVEVVEDGWSTEGRAVSQDSGTRRHRHETRTRYLRDEAVDGPDGSVVAAVLETEGEGLPTQRDWLDPAHPWCPLRVERLRIGQVVGTDVLVSREIVEPAAAPDGEADANPAQSSEWPAWLVLCVALFSIGLVTFLYKVLRCKFRR